jgi:hypothetical protein
LTEFQELVEGQFGPVRGASMLVDHVLTAFGGRTAAQAIEDGSRSARRLARVVRRLRRPA